MASLKRKPTGWSFLMSVPRFLVPVIKLEPLVVLPKFSKGIVPSWQLMQKPESPL
jgi:hypothetical protein